MDIVENLHKVIVHQKLGFIGLFITNGPMCTLGYVSR